MKNRIEKKYGKKKFNILIITFCVIMCAILGTVGISVLAGNSLMTPAEYEPYKDSVTFEDGRTYTKDNPYVFLEVVVDDGMAEMGYMAGGDSLPIPYSDIQKLAKAMNVEVDAACVATPNNLSENEKTIRTLVENWKKCLSVMLADKGDGVNYYDYYNTISNDFTYVEGYEDRNILANHICQDSRMSDKFVVKSVKASELTIDIVDSANLVYFNTQSHFGDTITVYDKMAELCNTYKPQNLSKTYNKTNKSTTYDFSAEVALRMYDRIANEGMAVVFDKSIYKSDSSMNNYSKLYTLTMGIETSEFVKQYYLYYDSDNHYHGTSGSVAIDNGVLSVKTVIDGTEYTLPWSSGMFYYLNIEGLDNKGPMTYPAYVADSTGGRSGLYVHQNVVVHPGTNFFDMAFGSGETNQADDIYKINGVDTYSTDFKHVKDQFGEGPGGGATYIDMIRYIVGYKFTPANKDISNKSFPIKILEIEPAGGYDYGAYNSWEKDVKTRYEDAKDILYKLGMDTSKVTSSNFNDYVTFTYVSTNGFNGMANDIMSDYDLIYIGENVSRLNMDFRDTSLSGKAYTVIGDEVYIRVGKNSDYATARYSGNDLTLNSLQKLTKFAESGMPIIIADGVYKGTTSTSTSYMRQLRDVIKYNNVVSVTQANNKKLLSFKDAIKNLFNSKLKLGVNVYEIKNENGTDVQNDVTTIKYDGNKLVNNSVTAGNSIQFDIDLTHMESTKGDMTYTVGIYMDKNGDGIFNTNITNDDYDEVLYQNNYVVVSGDNTKNLTYYYRGTENVTGYFSWKVVVEKNDKGKAGVKVAESQQGAFVVKQTDISTVRVLQILPSNPTKPYSLELDDSKFSGLFTRAEAYTGYKLKVDKWYTDNINKGKIGNTKIYPHGYNSYENDDIFGAYNMIVIGYCEVFGGKDITNTYFLSNLQDYLDAGKSMLLTHDTMTYTAYSDGLNYVGEQDGTEYGLRINSANWSKTMTRYLRNMVGMDRYGVAMWDDDPNNISTEIDPECNDPRLDTPIEVNDVTKYTYRELGELQGYSNLLLGKHGWTSTELLKKNDEKNQKGTQQYRYGESNNPSFGLIKVDKGETTNIQQLNSGQITNFPYNIDQRNVAQTHGQWFQLDLECKANVEDQVVVWYTLGNNGEETGTGAYTGATGRDAMNNYYIYSRGNVTYSGAGHGGVQISGDNELKLFVNTLIRAIASANNVPKITVTSGVDKGADETTGVQKFQQSFTTTSGIRVNFKAQDADLRYPSSTSMLTTGGKFAVTGYGSISPVYMYWDADKDGKFTENVDYVISVNESYKAYNDNVAKYDDTIDNAQDDLLYNGYLYSITLIDDAGNVVDALKDATYKGQTFKELLFTNEVVINLEATDHRSAKGRSTCAMVYQKLFNLD